MVLCGAVVAVGMLLAFGGWLTRLDPGKKLTAKPRTFGDIQIWAQTPTHEEIEELDAALRGDVREQLYMARDGRPFL